MVYILLGEGFEEIEALAPADILRRAGIEVATVGLTGCSVTGAHGITVQADKTMDEISEEGAEMLVLPGGSKGVASIKACAGAIKLIETFMGKRKLIAAICAAPTILAELGLIGGMRAVVYPGLEDVLENAGVRVQPDERVTQDHNLITAQAAGSAMDFSLKLVTVLRGWYAAEKVRTALYYHGNERSLT